MSSDCCSSSHKPPARAACPGCHQPGESVSTTTLLHQLTAPWQQSITDAQYYFCSQSGCEVVYFNIEGGRFAVQDMRLPVGQKSDDVERTVCYCFDIHQGDLSEVDAAKQYREFVIEKTRDKACACDIRNPSGRCCLRDFPKVKE